MRRWSRSFLSVTVTLMAACSADVTPGGGGDEDAGEAPGTPDGAPATAPDAGGPPPGVDAAPPMVQLPIDRLDQLSLVIVVGDSLAAGYNAPGNNGTGGRGYARLMVTNHADFPAYAGHDLATLYPGVQFRNLAESGATSGDAVNRVKGALSGSLPASVPGDVLVLINVGGNDFNDSVATMISTPVTQARAAELRANLAEIIALLRERYDDPAAGKRVEFLVDNIHDSTDGLGTVPPQFDDGFCGTIQNPIFTPDLRALALSNLALMNDAVAAEAAAQEVELVDIQAAFIGHGMNSGDERFIDGDCAHPTAQGHDLIRRLSWEILTGERY